MGKLGCDGGGVEGDPQPLFPRAAEQGREGADLVLEQQPVAGREIFEHCFDHLFPDHLVCAAEEQDAVLARLVDLDDGVAGPRARKLPDIPAGDARLPQRIEQQPAVFADAARMENLRPRPA